MPGLPYQVLQMKRKEVQNLYYSESGSSVILSDAMRSYGQYCPVARAAEILSQRWTVLLLRDLLGGIRRFNELRKGVPLMSP